MAKTNAIRELLAKAYTTDDVAFLKSLAEQYKGTKEVLKSLVYNPNTPVSLLYDVNTQFPDFLPHIIRNPNYRMEDVIKAVVKYRNLTTPLAKRVMTAALDRRADFSPDDYRAIARTNKISVLRTIASDPKLPYDVYHELKTHKDKEVQLNALANVQFGGKGIDIIISILKNTDMSRISAVSKNPKVNKDTISDILCPALNDYAFKCFVSHSNPDISKATLEYLLNEPSVKTSSVVAGVKAALMWRDLTAEDIERLFRVLQKRSALTDELCAYLLTNENTTVPIQVAAKRILQASYNAGNMMPYLARAALKETKKGTWKDKIVAEACKQFGVKAEELSGSPIDWVEESIAALA